MKRQDYDRLLADLDAEARDLDVLVADLSEAEWDRPTPAEGWTVRDQIAHLAATETWALCSLRSADVFRARVAELVADPERRAQQMKTGLLGCVLPPTGALEWWREERAATLAALRDREPSDRVPWFGPDMSAVSLTTARLMETWAHGQDVVDALDVQRAPTARLRHVAEIGVRTRGFVYVSRGMTVPDAAVRVELAAPDGGIWTWGPEDAGDRVRGSALDWSLVVTQRRNPADTDLVVDGDAAREWVGMAQAFAGPPTDHRPPGATTSR
jgi:uncharacterized protein (TIGR03084 family)